MNGKIKKILLIVLLSCCGLAVVFYLSGLILFMLPSNAHNITDAEFEVIYDDGRPYVPLSDAIPYIDGAPTPTPIPANPTTSYVVSFDAQTNGIAALVFYKDGIVLDIKFIDVKPGRNNYQEHLEGTKESTDVVIVCGFEHLKVKAKLGLSGYDKPVIYLYPEEETEVNVELDFHGDLTCTYPAYNDGWNVIASPDGTLTNLSDGRTYDYLFWEGNASAEYPMDNAVCVKGEDTCAFLEEYHTAAGLNDSEIDDFITYWLPEMQGNPYNLIAFQGELYEQVAELHVTPEPDSVLRIFMTFEALDEPVECGEFSMPEPFERSGFTVVEWGGTNLSK